MLFRSVGREQADRLRSEEAAPVSVEIAGRRADPTGSQDPADRASADPVAETDEFSLHPAVPPAGIFPGQPEDEVA